MSDTPKRNEAVNVDAVAVVQLDRMEGLWLDWLTEGGIAELEEGCVLCVTDVATIARPWAQVVPMSAREFMAAAAEQSEVRGRIVIRYRGEIDATMRFLYRGKWYAIHGVMPDADSGIEHLTLMVAEGVRLDQ